MMPSNVLSTDTAHAEFEYPRDIWKIPTHDYELGGVAVADVSQGLDVKLWHAFVDDPAQNIYIEADGVSPFVFVSDTDITEISLTFDLQMRPFVAWVAGGTAKYRWYDSTVSSFVTTSLAAGSTTPRCALDDRRPSQSASADIILGYMRNNSLQMRVQRDRYLTEYTLQGSLAGFELVQVGMNRGKRFQFQVRP